MLQTVDGKEVYVVDFDVLPKLPLTYATEEEKPYAIALARAIENGTISKPGKYGISIENHFGKPTWQAFEIIEDETPT